MPRPSGGGHPSCSGGAPRPATRTRSTEERNVTAETKSALAAVSDDLAAAVDRVRPSVVAIHARTRIPSSGVLWRAGVVVAADHTIKRDEDITITLHGGRTSPRSSPAATAARTSRCSPSTPPRSEPTPRRPPRAATPRRCASASSCSRWAAPATAT
jgi:hypothetical protein